MASSVLTDTDVSAYDSQQKPLTDQDVAQLSTTGAGATTPLNDADIQRLSRPTQAPVPLLAKPSQTANPAIMTDDQVKQVDASQKPDDSGLAALLGQDYQQNLKKATAPPSAGEVAATAAADTIAAPYKALTGKPILSAGEQAALNTHPLAKVAGQLIGGAALPLTMAAVPGVGLPVAFGAAAAIQQQGQQADKVSDPNYQPTAPSLALQDATQAAAGAITGKIFDAPTVAKVFGIPVAQTVAGRVAQRAVGVGATQIAGDLATQAAGGQPPDIKQAMFNAALATGTYGVVGGALELPELRSQVIDEGSRIAGQDLDFASAKKVLQDSLINPESVSPDFISAAYAARKTAFQQKEMQPLMKKYGITADDAQDILANGPGAVGQRQFTIAKLLADWQTSNPAKYEALSPYFRQIGQGADPADILMGLDLQNKILGPLQTKVTMSQEAPQVDPEVEQALNDIKPPQAPAAPKSVISQVRAMGGIDPAKAALAGYPYQDFKENGLFHVLRTGGLSPDDVGTILKNNNVISVGDNENAADALMATLKGDNSRLLEMAQASDDKYQTEYNQWLKENKDNAVTIPEEAISSLEADLTKKVNSQPDAVYTGWDDFGPGSEQPNASAKPATSPTDATAAAAGEGAQASTGPAAAPGAISDTDNQPSGPVEPKYKLEQPFYSQAAKVIDEKMPNAASPDQIRGILSPANGVKPDELNWLGLDDFLAGKTKVNKADLQQYLSDNQVRVNDVEYNNKASDEKSKQLQDNLDAAEPAYKEALQQLNGSKPYISGPRQTWFYKDADGQPQEVPEQYHPAIEKYSSAEQALSDHAIDLEEGYFNKSETKYGAYQIPGGKNYRELLLTLPRNPKLPEGYKIVPNPSPSKTAAKFIVIESSTGNRYGSGDTEQEAMESYTRNHPQNAGVYRSRHFAENHNILAHVRMNDRTDADGKKNLFIEEVQSDWHQQGKKDGYENNARAKQLEAEIMKIIDEKNGLANDRLPSNQMRDEQRWHDLSRKEDALREAYDKVYKGVPNAPFKKTWQELAMKRMLRYAAEHGYDRLSWTTGDQQAERYDLSKQVDKVRVRKRSDGTYNISVNKTGESSLTPIKEQATAAELPDIIGKDLAKKVLEQETGPVVTYEGGDLKVGGEGMKGFYDQILPSFMNKYIKKFGAQVGKTTIEEHPDSVLPEPLHQVHYIDITPSMRASVMQGQPLFKTAPSWDDLLADKKAYEDANKSGAELIKQYVPLLEKSLVNPAYIYTRQGANALGMYLKGQISVKSGAGANVYIHELGHAVFDMFLTPDEKATLMTEGKKIYGKNADVEERIMQDFERYYEDQRARADASIYAKVKTLFNRLVDRIKQFFGSNSADIKSFYDAILDGKYKSASPVKDYANQPQYKKDEVPAIVRAAGSVLNNPAITQAAQAVKEITSLISPRSLVPRNALDMIMTMKGQRDKAEFILESKLMALEKAFDKMPRQDQIAFIDNIKRGTPQATPALTQIANMMRTVEDQYWNEAKKYKPSLAYKENHFRVMWKVIPGSDEATGGFKGLFRRPFQGTQGWAKKSTLADMSEGLEAGGVPYSHNPVTMWRNSIMDMQKFITARRMWDGLKKMGYVHFVRFGKRRPDGFVALNDAIAQVYLPVEATLTEGAEPVKVMADMGKYYVEEGSGRVLNNFLGRDYIRESTVGKNLLAFKNLTTGIELGLSPFHAAYVSLMSMSSSTGLGLQKIVNTGMRQGKISGFLDGLRDIATGLSGAAPVAYAKTGAAAIKYMGEDNFLNSKLGQDFIKQYPDAAELIDDLFTGGGKLAIHQDYKINSLKAFQLGIRDFGDAKRSFEIAQANNDKELMKKYALEMGKNAWAETIHLLPSVNQMIMRPLFELYIPRLKVGAFLKEYSHELQARRDQLESGRLTRAQLSREVWDSVERRFGEMNFDNLFWNRNFKTALQITFRSVTWKLGALQNIGGAGTGQFSDLKAAFEDKKTPLLNRNLAMLLGLALMVTLFAEIFQRLMIGEGPKNLTDIMDPRYDKAGNRLFLNTHLKDWAHLFHSPGGFISNSTSGMIVRVLEDWHNKDFHNVEIAHPGDPFYKQDWDLLKHLIDPRQISFMLSNQSWLKLEDAPWAVKVATGLGFTTPAPGYVTKSPALQMAEEIRSGNMPAGARTQEQFQEGMAVHQVEQAYDKNQDESILDKALTDEKINQKQYNEIEDRAEETPLERVVKNFSYQQVANVMEHADKDERDQLINIFQDKIDRKLNDALGGPPDQYKELQDFKQKVLDRYIKEK